MTEHHETARSAPPWIGADELARRVSPSRARELLRAALAAGLDPSADPPRTIIEAGPGHLLLMPSAGATAVGTKVVSLTRDNPARGLPSIQAVYVLMDAETLTPWALIDGIALTNLRTPAVSAVAMQALAPDDVDSAVIVGSGPQALGHAAALVALRPVRRITVAGRDADRADACAREIASLEPVAGSPVPGVVSTVDRAGLEDAVRSAQVVMCCTSSPTPVIEGAWVADGACVVAVGSHEPENRELDSSLMGRAVVVVEDVAAAMREAGDVIRAVEDGALDEGDLHTLAELVAGNVSRSTDRPHVFKSIGMSWEDLVVAEGALTR
jgi:ornithine cyclodeaminase/alanine dehydrogenase-like protein (mu-crystallin family)